MIDHVVFAVPNLADGVGEFQRLVGVNPVRGGSHTNLGTANYLVDLGGAAYLEIIGPDPDQPDPAQPRPFGIDNLTASRVVAWCVSSTC
jgi:Glyoxalase-like domain